MKRTLSPQWRFLLQSAISRGVWGIDGNSIDDYQNIIKNIDSMASSMTDEALPISGAGSGSDVVAVLNIRGIMLRYGTPCSYGADEYSDYLNALAEIPEVCAVVLSMDTVGGYASAVAPIAQALQKLRSKGKVILANVDTCASAGYYVASYCDKVFANNESSCIGSIGCMITTDAPAEKPAFVHIYAPQSIDKNAPFNEALEGKYDKIREEVLRPLADNFIKDVKNNRQGVLDVNANGALTGKMFYANDALIIGLIDGIQTLEKTIEYAKSLSTIKKYENND